MSLNLLSLLVFCLCYTIHAQVGDKCTVKITNKRGICKEITQCASAEEQTKRGIDQTLCGFTDDLITAIVCCEDTIAVNDNLFPSNYNPNSEEKDHQRNTIGRISEQKCEEYSRSITSVVQVLPLVSDATPIPVITPKCEYNSVPLIVGGQPAEAGEFPFMVAIGFNTTNQPWRCGGTLISERFIVTAAHCTTSRKVGPPVVVRLGELDMSTDKEGSEHKDYILSRIIVHPRYSYPHKYNDIALLKTRETIQFTNFIRPACLYLNSNLHNGQALATGWGQTEFIGDSSDKLMKVTLNIYSNQRCMKTFPVNNENLPRGIDTTMLCAGEVEGGKDTCYGDSGGPLVITKRGNLCQFFLVGVTSFGKLCGQRNPAIYTRISEYIQWIENTVW